MVQAIQQSVGRPLEDEKFEPNADGAVSDSLGQEKAEADMYFIHKEEPKPGK